VDGSRFEFSVSVPRDERFVATVRSLAVQAARYASCGEAAAESFGASVESAVRARLRDASTEVIAVVVRRAAGPLEVLVDGRPVTVEP
jgi:hypothetical protein